MKLIHMHISCYELMETHSFLDLLQIVKLGQVTVHRTRDRDPGTVTL
jgi:hypothetical protein